MIGLKSTISTNTKALFQDYNGCKKALGLILGLSVQGNLCGVYSICYMFPPTVKKHVR